MDVKDGEDVLELRRICIHPWLPLSQQAGFPLEIATLILGLGTWKVEEGELWPRCFPRIVLVAMGTKLMAAVAFSDRSIYLPFVYAHVVAVWSFQSKYCRNFSVVNSEAYNIEEGILGKVFYKYAKLTQCEAKWRVIDALYFLYWPALYVFYSNDTVNNRLSLGGAFGLATINGNLLPWTYRVQDCTKSLCFLYLSLTSKQWPLALSYCPESWTSYTDSTPHQVLPSTLFKYLLPSLIRRPKSDVLGCLSWSATIC